MGAGEEGQAFHRCRWCGGADENVVRRQYRDGTFWEHEALWFDLQLNGAPAPAGDIREKALALVGKITSWGVKSVRGQRREAELLAPDERDDPDLEGYGQCLAEPPPNYAACRGCQFVFALHDLARCETYGDDPKHPYVCLDCARDGVGCFDNPAAWASERESNCWCDACMAKARGTSGGGGWRDRFAQRRATTTNAPATPKPTRSPDGVPDEWTTAKAMSVKWHCGELTARRRLNEAAAAGLAEVEERPQVGGGGKPQKWYRKVQARP